MFYYSYLVRLTVPSKTSKMLNFTLKKLVQGNFNPHLNVEKLRMENFPKPSPMAKKNCFSEDFLLDKIQGSWLFPHEKKSNKIILYFHGGAYVYGPSILQWRMLSHISKASGYTALLIDYCCAPEHPYPAGMEDMEKVFDYLTHFLKSDQIIFVGDSAGAGLALGLAMKLRDRKKDLPAKLVLLSPWLDVTMTNKEIEEQADLDNMLAIPGLQEAGQMYRGKADPENPYISPVRGNIKGLPPMYLMIGTHDLFLPDCRKFHKRAQEEGISLKYEEWEEMFHDWMLNIPYLPEATKAVQKITMWI